MFYFFFHVLVRVGSGACRGHQNQYEKGGGRLDPKTKTTKIQKKQEKTANRHEDEDIITRAHGSGGGYHDIVVQEFRYKEGRGDSCPNGRRMLFMTMTMTITINPRSG